MRTKETPSGFTDSGLTRTQSMIMYSTTTSQTTQDTCLTPSQSFTATAPCEGRIAPADNSTTRDGTTEPQNNTAESQRKQIYAFIKTKGGLFPGFAIDGKESPVSRMARELKRFPYNTPSYPHLCLGAVSSALGRGLEVEYPAGVFTRGNLFIAVAGIPGDFGTAWKFAFHRGLKDLTVPSETEVALSLASGKGVVDVVHLDGNEFFRDHLSGKYSPGEPTGRFLLRCFNGQQVRVANGEQIEVVERPCITLAMGIHQQYLLKLCIQNLAQGAGIAECLLPTARWWGIINFDCPRTKVDKLDRQVVAHYDARLSELREVFRLSRSAPERIGLSGEAREILDDFKEECRGYSSGPLSPFGVFVRRWPQLALKIALNLHASFKGAKAGKCDIGPKTMAHAIRLQRWYGVGQVTFLNQVTEDDLVRAAVQLAEAKAM